MFSGSTSKTGAESVSQPSIDHMFSRTRNKIPTWFLLSWMWMCICATSSHGNVPVIHYKVHFFFFFFSITMNLCFPNVNNITAMIWVIFGGAQSWVHSGWGHMVHSFWYVQIRWKTWHLLLYKLERITSVIRLRCVCVCVSICSQMYMCVTGHGGWPVTQPICVSAVTWNIQNPVKIDL